jgi:iron complex outermembrane receptor protein
MYSTPTTEHYGLSLRRSFSSHVEAYVDASRSSNRAETWTDFSSAVSLPATAPTNPFTEAIRVTFPNLAPILDGQYFSNSARLAAGVVVRLPADWTAGADYVYSSSQFKSVTPAGLLGDPDGTGPGISYNTAVSSGVLNVVRDLYANPLNLTPYFMPSPYNISDGHLNANEWTLRASGPVWKLPAGPLALSASAQYRTEEVPGFVQTSRSPTTPTPTYRWSPRVNSHGLAYYVEARVPLIAAESRLPFVRALELQLSARQDDFTLRGRSDNSSLSLASPDGPFPAITLVDHKYRATKGTVGFKYVVTEDFALRASAGTGFLPPTLSQATPTAPSVQTVTFFDPKRGGSQTVTATLLQGGSPDVKPEESKSLSAGAVFTPKFIKGLRLSVDYTRITKTDEITTLTGPDLVALEAYFPGRVVRATLTPADQGRGYTGGVIQQIDTSSMNVTGKELEAWDVQADYSWKTASLGEFHAYSLATYQPHFRRKVTPQVDWLENAGYSGSPIKWRGNGGLDWKRGSWTVGWNAQYYDSYFIYSATASAPAQATAVLNQGSARFPSQIYHDLSVAYRWGAQPGGWLRLLANGQLTVVVQNVFNTSPPILATLDPLNPTNSYSNYGDPRLRRYSISLRKKF